MDYVAALGGGTVCILPGRYLMRDSLHLRSHVRLLGSGEDTVLPKADAGARASTWTATTARSRSPW